MKKLLLGIITALFAFGVVGLANPGDLHAKKVKAKFYDFSDTVIDGETKKPTDLYIDAKQKVKFDRLLKLKKSFLNAMMKTSKERILK